MRYAVLGFLGAFGLFYLLGSCGASDGPPAADGGSSSLWPWLLGFGLACIVGIVAVGKFGRMNIGMFAAYAVLLFVAFWLLGMAAIAALVGW